MTNGTNAEVGRVRTLGGNSPWRCVLAPRYSAACLQLFFFFLLQPQPTLLIPANDAARVEALHRYQVLDATNERIFDDLAALTARLFQTPISLISLVDQDEVLFKGNYGLPGAERVERQLSLCSTAILQDETIVFEDLQANPCQLTDPLLARELALRFYAGHALQTADGYNIGTLCVIDRQPRTFSAADDALLTTLARVVMRLLDLRVALDSTAATSFKLWEPVYGAIGGQLRRLTALAEQAATTAAGQLTPAMNKEAAAIAGIIDQYIAATLKRV
jgi:GAF domain-containing protein